MIHNKCLNQVWCKEWLYSQAKAAGKMTQTIKVSHTSGEMEYRFVGFYSESAVGANQDEC